MPGFLIGVLGVHKVKAQNHVAAYLGGIFGGGQLIFHNHGACGKTHFAVGLHVDHITAVLKGHLIRGQGNPVGLGAGIHCAAAYHICKDLLDLVVIPAQGGPVEVFHTACVGVIPQNGTHTGLAVGIGGNLLQEFLDGGVVLTLVGNNPVFADDHRDAVFDILGLQLVQVGFQQGVVCIGAPGGGIAPAGICFCYTEGGGFIVVYGNRNHICGIGRCGEVAGQALVRVVVGCRHQQQTLCVVAAGCTDGIHKCLVEGHHLGVGHLDFVDVLKDHSFVVILEVGGDLLPQVGKLALSGGVQPACLVVGVDDAVHVVVDAVIRNGLDPGKICVHIHLALQHLIPGNRNPDGLEARLFDFLDHGFCGEGVAPGGFNLLRGKGTGVPGIGTAQGITQVPAQTHVLNHIDCGGVCSRHSGKTACKGACQGHAQCGSGYCAEQLLFQLHAILLPFFAA